MTDRKATRNNPAWRLAALTLLGTLSLPRAAGAQTTPTAVRTTTATVRAKDATPARAVGSLQANEKVLRVQLKGAARPLGGTLSQPAVVDVPPLPTVSLGAPLVTAPRSSSVGTSTTTLNRAPLEGVVLHSDNSQTQLDTNASSVTLRQGDLLVTRNADAPQAVGQPQVEGATSVKLPYEVLFIDERGTTRHCEVVAEMAGGGMRLIGDSSEFTTQIYVGLRDQEKWDSVYALPRPLRLLVTANVDRVAPDLVAIDQTDDFKAVELRAADPPPKVKVQVRAADKGLELDVPVHRPRATIDVNPKTIQGFGLESAKVHVRTEGLPNPKGRSVRLQTSSGRLDHPGLTLDENGVASAELRSAGFGPVSVEVSVFQLTPDKSEVEFAWPWRFLGFALLGGALGSAIQWLRASSAHRRSHWKPVLAGVLTGLMAAAASAVGINLLAIELPSLGGESLALVIAALGAWGLKVNSKEVPTGVSSGSEP